MSAYGCVLRALLKASMAGPSRHWQHVMADACAAQRARLLDILSRNETSAFGKEHGFASIHDVDAYRAQIPIVTYEELRSPIEAMMRGQANVLTTEAPTMFTVTSGTSGRPKHLPVTPTFTQEQHRPHRLWMRAMVHDHPYAADHAFLTIVSPAVEGVTDGGIPYGSMSGKNYRDQAIPIRLRHAVPYDVMALKNQELKYFTLLAHALTRDVSSVTAVNPSTLFLLGQRMQAWGEALVACLERQARTGCDGFSDFPDVSADERRVLEQQLRPAASRVRRLREILQTDGMLLPRNAWTTPKVLCTWHGGNAPFYLARLAEFWGDCPTRCLGLRASEGVFSIPVADATPEGILAVDGHFLEFIPEETDVQSDTHTLLANELEKGQRYRLIITTSGGLYRYDLGDVVEVTGYASAEAHADKVPLVAFLHRAGNTLSITGEKVTETQTQAAVIQTLADMPPTWHARGYTVTVRMEPVPHYVLAVECLEWSLASDDERLAWAHAFDRALGHINCEYAAKRESQRLGIPEILPLPDGAYARWRQRKVAEGTPDGQIKPPHFAKNAAFLNELLS